MHKLAILVALLVMPGINLASQAKTALQDVELRGVATFRYLGFPLYEARLFTKGGTPLDWNVDFGLELTYLRNLTAFDLVESTMQEPGRTGGDLPVRDQLNSCFVDIRKGDRYLAFSQGQNKIGFWRNDRRICMLCHPRIKTRFMAIFLGENTRSKSFTRRLRDD